MVQNNISYSTCYFNHCIAALLGCSSNKKNVQVPGSMYREIKIFLLSIKGATGLYKPVGHGCWGKILYNFKHGSHQGPFFQS